MVGTFIPFPTLMWARLRLPGLTVTPCSSITWPEVPTRVYKADIATGRKQFWKKFVPPDISGVTDIGAILITPDGHNYVWEYGRTLSDLYLVNDVKGCTNCSCQR